MKRLLTILIAVALFVAVSFLLWRGAGGSRYENSAYGTTMQISGTPGAAFTGEYIRNGKSVSFSAVVPWSLTESNISRLKLRKAKTGDSLILDAHGGGSMVSATSEPGSKGLQLSMEGGWNVEVIR